MTPKKGFLGAILLIYFCLGWQYALQTPAWQVPDEPAHYNYVRQIAENRQLPVIKAGDWDSDYQNQLVSSGFAPQYTADLARVEYEDHQPPLYYLLLAPVYALSDGDLMALRLWSLFLSVGILLAAFAVLAKLFPAQPWLAPTAIALMAFNPQYLAILSGVNNDMLALLSVSLIFWQVLRYWEAPTWKNAAYLGLLVGFAFLSKSTVYFLAGIGGCALLLKWRREKWNWRFSSQHLAAYLIPALLLGAMWWGRNIAVYGGSDFLGLQSHDEVAAGQLQTSDYIEENLGGDNKKYWQNLANTTFNSFWGQFGWMAVPMETRIYRLLQIGILGMILGLFWWSRQYTLSPLQADMFALFGLSVLLVGAAFWLYNRQFVQFQGRYLYPALLPLATWGAMGLSGWIGLLASSRPRFFWLAPLLAMGLAGLAWYALQSYLIPNLPAW